MKNNNKAALSFVERYRKLEKDFFVLWSRLSEELKETDVHKMRTTIRKISAIFQIMAVFRKGAVPKKISDFLKNVFDELQELRDVQVQAIYAAGMTENYPEIMPFLNGLNKSEAGLTKKCRKVFRDNDPMALTKQWNKLDAALFEPELEEAAGYLDTLFDNLLTAKGRIDRAKIRTLHRFRISFKKFRYSFEALSSVIGIKGAALFKRMGHYQDRLGEIQDIDVLSRSLKTFRGKESGLQTVIGEVEKRKARLCGFFMRNIDRVYHFRAFHPQGEL
ncbi:MAG: hypothetical protein A2Y33_12460 [Spirochaetes bacterium GWF1_51_8]|nr:MAG: hypothetical protein A2Y33_12460 [Spirochaetes bacterium GWF1_51_8]